jgi:polysaccharide pyruvyl transferase WcaK-like protein
VKAKVSVPVTLLSADFNAAELKWLISRCAIFAGARTHSTIAAISSQVPTLSVSYSLKAKGINRDVYGHLDYCIHVSELTPQSFQEGLQNLLTNEAAIRERFRSRVPELVDQAFGAGTVLQDLLRVAPLQRRA